jgi:hypothetical protein
MKKEESELKRVEKCMAALNCNVTEDIQLLFDRMNSIFSAEWKGTNNSMILLEEYRIDPPYDKVTVLKGCEGQGIDRIKQVVRRSVLDSHLTE